LKEYAKLTGKISKASRGFKKARGSFFIANLALKQINQRLLEKQFAQIAHFEKEHLSISKTWD
jgi:hypothetical protein